MGWFVWLQRYLRMITPMWRPSCAVLTVLNGGTTARVLTGKTEHGKSKDDACQKEKLRRGKWIY